MRRRPLPHTLPGPGAVRHELEAAIANRMLEDVIVGFGITRGTYARIECPWGELPIVEAFGNHYALSGYLAGGRGGAMLYGLNGKWADPVLRISVEGELVDRRSNRVLGVALEVASYVPAREPWTCAACGDQVRSDVHLCAGGPGSAASSKPSANFAEPAQTLSKPSKSRAQLRSLILRRRARASKCTT